MLSKKILLYRVHANVTDHDAEHDAHVAYLKAWKLTMQENEP